MKHEKALAIRTLTEAMTNAHQLGDNNLRDVLRDQIFGMIIPTPADPVLEKPEAAAPEAPAESNLTDNDHAVLGFLNGGCPCCVLFDALVEGRDLPLGNEEFIYTLGAGAGYDDLAATMQALADKAQKHVNTLEGADKQSFVLRFNSFTLAGIEARKRLAADGLAPALDERVERLNEILGPLAKVLAERVRGTVH